MAIFSIARLELLIARRNMWVATSVVMMSLFTVVLTLAGGAPTGTLGVFFIYLQFFICLPTRINLQTFLFSAL